MLRTFFSVLIVLVSCYVGNFYSVRLKQRKDALEQFISLLNESSSRIAYTMDSVYDIYSDNAAGYKFSGDRDFNSQWEEFVRLYALSLTKDDMKLIGEFGNKAGSKDKDAEQKQIKLYLDLLASRLDDAEKQREMKSKIYRTLGLCVGIAISLLVI